MQHNYTKYGITTQTRLGSLAWLALSACKPFTTTRFSFSDPWNDFTGTACRGYQAAYLIALALTPPIYTSTSHLWLISIFEIKIELYQNYKIKLTNKYQTENWVNVVTELNYTHKIYKQNTNPILHDVCSFWMFVNRQSYKIMFYFLFVF